MSLQRRQTIGVPPHQAGGFDHADVHPASGRVFVAHTAYGQVEILDGVGACHERTVPDCPEGSGVLYAPEVDCIFAAARSTGQILVLAPLSGDLVRTIAAGARPNGLAWDPGHRHLLVAMDFGLLRWAPVRRRGLRRGGGRGAGARIRFPARCHGVRRGWGAGPRTGRRPAGSRARGWPCSSARSPATRGRG